MSVLKSFCSAFLMYSRFPVPEVEWKEENRRYALCFFPLVGAMIGGLFLTWGIFCGLIRTGSFIFAAGAVILPILTTGGIHLDGFCDVCDAEASFASRERQLEIMDDPHIGSFAAMRLGMYLLFQAALFSRIDRLALIEVCALIFIQSRSWSALAAVCFKGAKTEGTLQSFSRPAHKRITVLSQILYLTISLVLAIKADILCAVAAVAAEALIFVIYRFYSLHKFGGITGDTEGWFLQLCELAALAAIIFAELISRFLEAVL